MTAESRSESQPFFKSFAGHETFAFRHAWLKKGFDQLSDDPAVFQREDAVVALGVGKNMVRSIRHWCLAARVAEEEPDTKGKRLRATSLATALLREGGWDTYMEDDATLWLIHWNLASKATRAATWYWTFNRFHEFVFTRAAMADALLRHLGTLGWTDIAESTIRRDVDCLLHAYLPPKPRLSKSDDAIECPLTSLGLLLQEPDGERLRFGFGPKTTLPAQIFAYALAEFWNTSDAPRHSIELREIMRSEGSPALVFRLDEESVLSYLDCLSDLSDGDIIFEDTALVRRVVNRGVFPIASLDFLVLESYYAGN